MLTSIVIVSMGLWLQVSAIITEQAYDLMGCQALVNILTLPVYKKNSQCHVKDIEILPHFYFLGEEVSDATECAELCKDYLNCDFWSFIEPKRVQAQHQKKMCYLKQDVASLITMKQTARHHLDSVNYDYTSGFRNACQFSCKEEKEASPGCHASSISSCSQMNQLYDPLEIATGSDQLFPCCNAQKTPDRSFYINRVISTPKIFKAFLTGINSPEDCHTQCTLYPGCTAWNHVTSPITSYIGGSCYLMKPSLMSDISYESLLTSSATSFSAVGCNDNGHCTSSLVSPYQDIFLEEPIPGTCNYANLDLTHFYDIEHEVNDVSRCQVKCQLRDGCNYWMLKWNRCFLSYSNYNYMKTTSAADASVVGLKNCDMKRASTCLQFDTRYKGIVVADGTYVEAAEYCLNICEGDFRCKGWSFSDKRCYIYSEVEGSTTDAAWISALRECKPSA